MATDERITKRCPRCNQTLPAEAFTQDRRTTTGLKCYCRQCCAAAQRVIRAAKPKPAPKPRPRKPLPQRDAKVCPRCRCLRTLAAFGADKHRRDGLKPWCKDCCRAANRLAYTAMSDVEKAARNRRASIWRCANPDKNAIYMRRWRKRNPDSAKSITHARRARLREATGKYTSGDIAALLKAQTGRCAYCRKLLKKAYHIDHIVPLAKGGTNWPRNLQLTCHSCNSRKHAQDPIDFAQRLGRLL